MIMQNQVGVETKSKTGCCIDFMQSNSPIEWVLQRVIIWHSPHSKLPLSLSLFLSLSPNLTINGDNCFILDLFYESFVYMHAYAHRGQKRVLDLLEPELQNVIHYMGTENQAHIVCKGNKCSKPLSQLSSPTKFNIT